MAKNPKRSRKQAEEYFSSESSKFCGLAKHALLISNRIGQRETDAPRIWASWLFMRACVTTLSIQQLYDPPRSGYGDACYLDHGSIAGLCRALIENIAVLLYIGDPTLNGDEWMCRKHLIDLHDYRNRNEFLSLLNHEAPAAAEEKTFQFLRERLEKNSFFKTIPGKRQKRLLSGDDMFIEGRHAAMLKLGWGNELTKGVYKYLSQQAHSQSMAFHRTEINRMYERNSPGAKVVAGFATEFARSALGVGALRMLSLFPDVELAFDPVVLSAIKAEYAP
jgi:Family of unknown function (DUF5677)